MNFHDLSYLKNGSPEQQAVYRALTENQLFQKLSAFTPFLAGTFPLDINVTGSDLDILCAWTDVMCFESELNRCFGMFDGYTINKTRIRDRETVIARFSISNYVVEIFGQNRPVEEQEGYSHMMIEYEILKKKGEDFKRRIIGLKNKQMKTEPAFASLLGLSGDPYDALLKLDVNKI